MRCGWIVSIVGHRSRASWVPILPPSREKHPYLTKAIMIMAWHSLHILSTELARYARRNDSREKERNGRGLVASCYLRLKAISTMTHLRKIKMME
ncbi:hypothetical protein M426DRAFT_196461 [Hypoxylon sp. CI-4A]|nr:hypothetical protein M426DRAFT_196461 [Hypoxylon sp. CI-4A]